MKVTWDASTDTSIDEYRVFVKEAGYWDTEISDFFGNGTVTSDNKYQILPYDDINNWYRTYSPVATVGPQAPEKLGSTSSTQESDPSSANGATAADGTAGAADGKAIASGTDVNANAPAPSPARRALAGPNSEAS